MPLAACLPVFLVIIISSQNRYYMKSLLLADIHGNLAALEAVLEQEEHWDEVISLGDVSGY